jgi:uncharacterized protein (TIGR02452 family)
MSLEMSNDEKTFSPEEWLEKFQHHVNEVKNDPKNVQKREMLPTRRLMIQHETLRCLKRGSYPYQDSDIKFDSDLLKKSVEQSIMYKGHEFDQILKKKFEKTRIQVVEGDCLDIALDFQTKYASTPVVLNMANAFTPGGGYKHGSGAQEENLFRRTNLSFCLDENSSVKWSYPIPEFGGIYTPEATVFRGAESKGYPYLNEVKYLSFIASAAYRHPLLTFEGELEKDFVEGTEMKIRTMLHIANRHNHSIVILSAFGCGAFRNPPLHIAAIFQKVLIEFDGCFEHVVFAIFDDHNAGKDGNLAPFKKVFSKSNL